MFLDIGTSASRISHRTLGDALLTDREAAEIPGDRPGVAKKIIRAMVEMVGVFGMDEIHGSG